MQTLQVQQTTDYSLFRPLSGNREVNEANVKRLRDSMKNKTLVSPIIVNEKYEIIDGQHRYQALRELGKPVQFLQVPGYGLHEVQILNANQKNWTTKEYLESYVNLGYDDYIEFRQFFNSFDFQFSAALAIASNTSGNKQFDVFRSGDFAFDDVHGAYDRAERITMVKKYFDGFNHTRFVETMIGLFKHQNFEFSKFISKLKILPTALEMTNSVESYKRQIEDIYNYRSRDKVSLRY